MNLDLFKFEKLPEAPKIHPVPVGAHCPLFSVMIPVCNRTKYLRQALESVFNENYPIEEMQICIVDNSTETIFWENFLSSEERKRVEIFKQPVHVSLGDNWNACIQQSRGHLVHILHDDDWILPGFYEEIQKLNNDNPLSALLATRSFTTDSDGVLQGISQRIVSHETVSAEFNIFVEMNPLFCPSIVFKRDFCEQNGGFISYFRHCIDWEMWLRATVKSGLTISQQPLCCYRYSSDADTHKAVKYATNLQDYLKIYLFSKETIADFPFNQSINYLIARAISQESEMKARGDLEAAALARKFVDTLCPPKPSTKIKWLLHGIGNMFKNLAKRTS
ncbi:MAG: glycosyltransferase [bacterium]